MLKTLIRGEYNRNLEKYFTEFGREKFFILSAHSIFHNASSRYDTLSRLGNFLGTFFSFFSFFFFCSSTLIVSAHSVFRNASRL